MQSLRLEVPQEGKKPVELEITDQGTFVLRLTTDALRSGFIHEAFVKAFEQIQQEEEYSIIEIYNIIRGRSFFLYLRRIVIWIFVDEDLVSIYNLDMTGDIYSIISKDWIDSEILRVNTIALRVFLTERYIRLQRFIKGLGKIGRMTRNIRILTGLLSAVFILIGTLGNKPIQFLNAIISLAIYIASNYFHVKNSLDDFLS